MRALPSLALPSSLPAWESRPHAQTLQPPHGRFDPRAGEPRLRRVSTRAVRVQQVSAVYTQDQVQAFWAWFESDAQAGALPFAARVLGADGLLTTWHARFVAPPEYAAVAAFPAPHWRVTAQLRLELTDCKEGCPEHTVWSAATLPSAVANQQSLSGRGSTILLVHVSGLTITVYRTTNGGGSWSSAVVPYGGGVGVSQCRALHNGARWVLPINAQYFAYSDDDGASWTVGTKPILGINHAAADPATGTVVLASSVSGHMQFSLDGTSFADASVPPPGSAAYVAAGDGYAIAVSSSTAYAGYSLDKGDTWAAGTSAWGAGGLGGTPRVAYGDGLVVMIVSNANDAYVSANKGVTWVKYSNVLPAGVANWRDLIFTECKFLAVNASRNLAAYTADGQTWDYVDNPFTTTGFNTVAAAGDDLLVAHATTNAANAGAC